MLEGHKANLEQYDCQISQSTRWGFRARFKTRCDFDDFRSNIHDPCLVRPLLHGWRIAFSCMKLGVLKAGNIVTHSNIANVSNSSAR
mgnify:CR=1 FL=1